MAWPRLGHHFQLCQVCVCEAGDMDASVNGPPNRPQKLNSHKRNTAGTFLELRGHARACIRPNKRRVTTTTTSEHPTRRMCPNTCSSNLMHTRPEPAALSGHIHSMGHQTQAHVAGAYASSCDSSLTARPQRVRKCSAPTLMPARSLLTTSVAKASDSTSSAMMSSGLWLFTVDSRSGMIELIVDTYG